jgi:TP901 family phage tail tape measure protein
MFKLAELFVEVGAKTKPFDDAMSAIKGRLAGLGKMRFNIPGGGFAAALGFGAGVAGIFKETVEIENKVMLLGKAADLTGGSLKKMKGAILDLSVSVKGVRVEDLFDIATAGAKMGIAEGDLIRYTEGIAKVSTAIDDLAPGVIADQIGKLNTIFKLGVDGTMQFGSAIDKLADSGVSSASGILDVSQRISGAAVTAKISAQETTALAAALLDTGTRAEMASSALLDLISALNEIKGRGHFAQAIGLSVEDFAKTVKEKPISAIKMLLTSLNKLDATGQMMTLKGIGIKGDTHAAEITKLAQQVDSLDRYIGLANNEFKTLDQITKSYNATAMGTTAQLILAQNQIKKLAEEIGSSLLPAINRILPLVGDLATGVGESFNGMKTTLEGWGVDFSNTLENASALFLNFRDVLEHTGVELGRSMIDLVTDIEFAYKLLGAGCQYAWDTIQAGMTQVGVIAMNVGERIINSFQAVIDWFAKGTFHTALRDALNGNFGGDGLVKNDLMRGVSWGGPDFVMPQRKRADVSDQLAVIEDRMNARAEDRRKKKEDAKAGGGKGRAALPGEDGAALPLVAKETKAQNFVTDADSYARDLQNAALNTKDVQKDILKQAEHQSQQLDQINKKLGAGSFMASGATFA